MRTFAALGVLCGKAAFGTIHRKGRQERKDLAKAERRTLPCAGANFLILCALRVLLRWSEFAQHFHHKGTETTKDARENSKREPIKNPNQ